MERARAYASLLDSSGNIDNIILNLIRKSDLNNIIIDDIKTIQNTVFIQLKNKGYHLFNGMSLLFYSSIIHFLNIENRIVSEEEEKIKNR